MHPKIKYSKGKNFFKLDRKCILADTKGSNYGDV